MSKEFLSLSGFHKEYDLYYFWCCFPVSSREECEYIAVVAGNIELTLMCRLENKSKMIKKKKTLFTLQQEKRKYNWWGKIGNNFCCCF